MTSTKRWLYRNPGAGGQIQDINLDPNQPGRAYLCSDMEGAYRSDDYGETWNYIGNDLSYSPTLTIAIEPGNSNRIYAGTVGGIEISDNAGQNWRSASQIENEPIMAIVINPDNVNEIYGVVSNRWRWAIDSRKQRLIGERGLYRSQDRGESWEYIIFESQQGRRDTFSLDIHPVDRCTLYVGAKAGLYCTKDCGVNWARIAQPDKTSECWGATLSPDGQVLYAAFVYSNRGTHLFATPTASLGAASIEWIDLSDPAKGFNANQNPVYWLPKLDPRSTSTDHKLLIASNTMRNGLYEVSLRWNNAQLQNWEWNQIFFYVNSKSAPFDAGWEDYLPRPLAWNYSPVRWPKRMIWTTGDQTLFAALTDSEAFPNDWQAKYTQFVRELGGRRFYQSRGAHSNYVFDCEAHGNYVVQCNADNGVLESYDAGRSWTIGIREPRSNAVAIVKGFDPVIVLAHTSPGFGATATQGTLWGKSMQSRTPTDVWYRVGGGADQKAGLPNVLYNQIAVDPHNPQRVLIGTHQRGIWMIHNVRLLMMSEATAWQITDGSELTNATINDKGGALIFDPITPDRVWVAAGRSLWQGGENADETWTWTRIKDSPTGVLRFDCWAYENQIYLACEMEDSGGNSWIELSIDGGSTWNIVVEFAQVMPLRNPAWYQSGKYRLDVAGLVGYQNKIYFSYVEWALTQRTYGMFVGTIGANGHVYDLQDFTDGHDYPFPVKNRILQDGGKAFLYMASRGSGLWRRELE